MASLSASMVSLSGLHQNIHRPLPSFPSLYSELSVARTRHCVGWPTLQATCGRTMLTNLFGERKGKKQSNDNLDKAAKKCVKLPAHRLEGPIFCANSFARYDTRLANISVPNQHRLNATASTSSAQLDGIPNSSDSVDMKDAVGFVGVHHVGIICQNLERSLDFYCGLLGLETCSLRPDKKLRYRGTWLWVGNQMIHLMELPNPDPVTGRPAHGGEDRHICVSIENPERLKFLLENAGIPYTMSKSGRPVIFARDPDGNAMEFQPSYMHATPRDK